MYKCKRGQRDQGLFFLGPQRVHREVMIGRNGAYLWIEICALARVCRAIGWFQLGFQRRDAKTPITTIFPSV